MDRRYLAAATLAGIGAALHFIALPLSGFAENFVPSLAGGAIWAALAVGLSRGSRLVAYLTFLMGLFGISAALHTALGTSAGLTQWIWFAILGIDALIVITLFALLWRARTT